MEFHKYHGTGNDFILVDNREGSIKLLKEEIERLCHRRFGIGADGLILLEQAEGYDFCMVYYNADGGESTMCGNGGRCITAFAAQLGIIKDKASFRAIDGPHTATINANGQISLHMTDVKEIQTLGDHAILNTGSPHYVQWVEDVAQTPVYSQGRHIRNQPEFQPSGINVNFVQLQNDKWLYVRTYERGVEDETFSCGTGVTAAAIASTALVTGDFVTPVITPGGILQVAFTKDTATSATNVVLTGPAVLVFSGKTMKNN